MPLEEFPDHLIKAVLATEDRRFRSIFRRSGDRFAAENATTQKAPHFGIDFPGTFRALTTNIQAQLYFERA